MRRTLLTLLVATGCTRSVEVPRAPAPPPPAATHEAVALPGPCVDPVADTAPHFPEQPEGAVPYVTSVQAGPDLDGDGTPDQIVVVEQMRVISARLYAMRGTCGHFVGDLGAPPEKVANTMRSHGLIDLLSLESINCSGERCGCIPGRMWFRFDGTAYQLDTKVSTQSRGRPCPRP